MLDCSFKIYEGKCKSYATRMDSTLTFLNETYFQTKRDWYLFRKFFSTSTLRKCKNARLKTAFFSSSFEKKKKKSLLRSLIFPTKNYYPTDPVIKRARGWINPRAHTYRKSKKFDHQFQWGEITSHGVMNAITAGLFNGLRRPGDAVDADYPARLEFSEPRGRRGGGGLILSADNKLPRGSVNASTRTHRYNAV